MKRKLNAYLLAAGLLTGGLAHAQESILILVQSGHTGESSVREVGAWIESVRPGKYQIDFSADLSPNVLDSASALTQGQKDLLESYDLVLMPRYGVGGSSGIASTDWNDVETAIMLMNPFMVADGTRWGWVPSGTGTPSTPGIRDLQIAVPDSPYFDGINTDADLVQFTFWEEAIMQVAVSGSELTGTSIGFTDRRENDDDPDVATGDYLDYPWIHTWDGTEESYFEGGTEGPAAHRTLFLAQNPDSMDYYRTAGRQLFLNAISMAIYGESDPGGLLPDAMDHEILSPYSNAEVLFLTDAGEEDDAVHIAYTDFLTGYFPGINVTRSSAFVTNDDPLSTAQLEQLESYDLIIMPVTATADGYNTRTWNDVTTPLLNLNTFTQRRFQEPDPDADPPFEGYAGWSWWHSSTGGEMDLQDMTIFEFGHPIFAGALPRNPDVPMFTDVISTRRSITVPERIHGSFLGATAGDHRRSWISAWPGAESFGHWTDDSGTDQHLETPAGARVAFLVPGADGDLDSLTEEGAGLMLNSANWLLHQSDSRPHSNETFEHYPFEGDSSSLDGHQLSEWESNYISDIQLRREASPGGKSPNSVVMNIVNDVGWGDPGSAWRGLYKGPRSDDDAYLVDWSFNVRLNSDISGVSTTVAIGEDSGSDYEENMRQDNAAGLGIYQDGGSHELRYVDATGAQTAIADVVIGDWYAVSVTLDLAAEVYSMTISHPTSGSDFAVEDVPFIGAVNGLDYVAIFSDAPPSEALDITMDDILVSSHEPAPDVTGFAAWREANFPDDSADDAVSGPDADPDGDGIPNVLEYALGGDPQVANRGLSPVTSTFGENGNRYLQIEFSRDPEATDVDLVVERSEDLVSWTPIDGPVTSETNNGLDWETWRDAQPIADGERGFLRVNVLLMN